MIVKEMKMKLKSPRKDKLLALSPTPRAVPIRKKTPR